MEYKMNTFEHNHFCVWNKGKVGGHLENSDVISIANIFPKHIYLIVAVKG